jgi:hypothetical protein
LTILTIPDILKNTGIANRDCHENNFSYLSK